MIRALIAAGLLAHAAPALTAAPALRGRLPGLQGQAGTPHVALTFDDGPDPKSTPAFLHLLAERDVRATFFVLGSMLQREPHLGREIVDAGHELAVHGWSHRCLLAAGPVWTHRGLRATVDLIRHTTGTDPVWFRPPYGVLTTGALLAATRLGLRPVLWTAWGRDWRARATRHDVVHTVTRDLGAGGTVLLHDSDCTSAPGSWSITLAALPDLLDRCQDAGWPVGPLRDHISPVPGTRPVPTAPPGPHRP